MPKLTLNKKIYDINPLDCLVSGSWIDSGIGPYEFWGAQYVDKQMSFEIESIEISKATDEDNHIVTDPLLLQKLEEKALKEENFEQWAPLCSNYTPSECEKPPPEEEPDFLYE